MPWVVSIARRWGDTPNTLIWPYSFAGDCLFLIMNLNLFLLVLVVLVCGCRGSVKQHWIRVADSKIYVEESGRGDALILLHGGTLDHRMWASQVSEFKKYFRVFNIDIRGHGFTQDGDSSYLVSDALLAVLDTFGIVQAHVAGLSLGAVAATGFAIDHPTRVNKLVLASPGLIGFEIRHDSVYRRHQAAMKAAYEHHDTLAYIESFVRAWTDGPKRTPEEVSPAVRELTVELATENVFRNKWRHNPGFNFKPLPITQLGSIYVPTLVLVGEIDMTDILMIADTLARKIPYAQKVTIPGAAHMINLEQPAIFNRTVIDFLRASDRFAGVSPQHGFHYLAALQH